MEYPFIKCPKKTTEPAEVKPVPRFNPDNLPVQNGCTPEIVAKLIKQAITLEEESMKLLDLLVELIEQKPPEPGEANHFLFPENSEDKRRIFLD